MIITSDININVINDGKTKTTFLLDISGYPDTVNNTQPSVSRRSFQGCMQLFHVDDQLVDLHAVEQGKLGQFTNINIDMCAIIDR